MDGGIQTFQQGSGRGGARPGAGRPRVGRDTLSQWAKFERLIRSAAAKEITRDKLRDMAKADPWRFVERIMLPLIGMTHRSVGRVGVSVGEGASRTQFVLDFGDDGRGNELQQAGDVLGQLVDQGQDSAP